MASAQTEFPIHTNSPNLKAEFKKELDLWMVRAYEGDAEAQFKVGVLFANEQFNTPDFAQSVYWYKQAARQGHVLAQYNLGHQYLTGVGVEPSEATAMAWWLKAAEQNHPLSQFNVGRAYYLGIGVVKDLALSRSWFEKAARSQEPRSIEILEQLGWATPGQYARASTAPQTEQKNQASSSSSTAATETLATTPATPLPDAREASDPAPQVPENSITTAPRNSVVINTRPQRDSLARRADSADITSKVQPLDLPDEIALGNGSSGVPIDGQSAATEQSEPQPVQNSEIKTPPKSELKSVANSGNRPDESNTQNSSNGSPTSPINAVPAQPPLSNQRAQIPISQTVTRQAAPQVVVSRDDSKWRTNVTVEQNERSTDAADAIAVYTDPAIRSVLIAVLAGRDQLTVISQGTEWTSVRSTAGFPVWVSGDYINVRGNRGTITGSAVNARSVPIVTSGTVVGRLNKNETVSVLESRNDWYRILSPTRFTAWVKTNELKPR